MSTKKGRKAEDRARQYLEKKGYETIVQNIVILGGEVDILAKKGDALVIVEVKSTKKPPLIHPIYSITPAKIRRLLKTTYAYCNQHGISYEALQLDIVILQNNWVVEHHENISP